MPGPSSSSPRWKSATRLPLHDPARRPSREKARELIGPDNWYDRPADYRGRVARELFGLTDIARYRNLVHLLYGLRRPTIGDRIESGELVKVLSDALPPLDDDVIDKVAHNLDDLDSVRAELARLEKTNAALTTFLKSYRGYLRGVLRSRVGHVDTALGELTTKRRKAGDAERSVASLKKQEATASAVVDAITEARDTADADLRALRESSAYGALRDLRDKRETLGAIAENARTTWEAASRARDGEDTAAQRLKDGTDGIGRELSDLRGALRAARKAARGSGVDEALLADVPQTWTETLAIPATEQLTDPDGAAVEIRRPGTEAVTGEVADELEGWRTRLTESDTVLKARLRAAATLDGRLKEVAEAEREAASRREHAERLDADLSDASDRAADRGDDLVGASAGYAAAVVTWAARLPDPAAVAELVGLPDDPALVAEDRALGRDVPDEVAQAAHEVSAPVLKGYEEARDRALGDERGIERDLKAAKVEKARWEAQADPEPPRSAYSSAGRTPGTGAPLFLLVDFRESVPEADRSGLEAALEASGLLAGWMSADGTLLTDDTRDVIVRAGEPVAGPSLADALRPVPGHGVSEAALDRLLRGIGLEESAARTWVAPDGRYRLDVIRGAHGKDQAEYIGAGVRAATRQRRIEELTEQISQLETALADAVSDREEIDRLRDDLNAALRDIPRSRELAAAWSAYDHAIAEVTRLGGLLLTARRAAEQATAAATSLRTRAEAQATSDGLPADRERLAQLQRDLAMLRKDLEGMVGAATRVNAHLATHPGTRLAWDKARHARADAESGYLIAHGKLTAARRELALLEASVGASEQEIIAKETDAKGRFDAAERALPGPGTLMAGSMTPA